jgi:hypothetical protein
VSRTKDEMVCRLLAILDNPPTETVMGPTDARDILAIAFDHSHEVALLSESILELGGI